MKICVIGFTLALLLWGCGSTEETKNVPPSGPADTEWTQVIKPIVDSSCALSGCHANNAGFVQSGAAFKASSSKNRVSNNSMPVPDSAGDKAFSSSDRAKVLTYLSK